MRGRGIVRPCEAQPFFVKLRGLQPQAAAGRRVLGHGLAQQAKQLLPGGLHLGKLPFAQAHQSGICGVHSRFAIGLARLSAGAATGLFFAYSALNGLTFASLFILYDVTTLVYVFGMTAVYFGALAAYGWFTKRDLSNLRSILFAGLMFLLLYWVVAIFLPMGMFEKFICFVGLAVFLGYTAYDTQKIRHFYDAYRLDAEMAHKGAIFCALQLYLDFVNIFLYLLRLLGRRSSN